MIWNMASLAFDPYVELVVDMKAIHAKTPMTATTVTSSTNEKPFSALLALCRILPPLPGVNPGCREERCTTGARRTGRPNYLFSIAYGNNARREFALELRECNKTLQNATFEPRAVMYGPSGGDKPAASEKEART
jgi:hypothetical protein